MSVQQVLSTKKPTPDGVGFFLHMRTLLAIGAVLSIAGMLFFPGLSGGIHLDDYQNLKSLEQVPATASWLERFSFAMAQISGVARVLPQFSFVMQADAWPNEPEKFIIVNLLLHLVNGALVFLLAGKLGELTGIRHSQRVALLTALIWLTNPIQVAGVLYIVQRFNQIAAFFMLSGMLIYLHGRECRDGRPIRCVFWMVAGLAGAGGLAVLSKEGGVLLPLLVVVMEITLLANLPAHPVLMRARQGLLGGGILLVAVALAYWHETIMAGYTRRPFNWAERLLTEANVLLEYGSRILMPRGTGMGLIHDDFPIATWPPDDMTIVSLLLLLSMGAGALLIRKRWPIAAFAILWFFAAHALEASWIPLELYFEHRNYLPLFGIGFALAAGIIAVATKLGGIVRWVALACAMAWLASSAAVTYAQTVLWGKPEQLLHVWYVEHPHSARASVGYADLLASRGRLEEAASILRPLTVTQPEIYAPWILLGCRGWVSLPPLHEVTASYRSMPYAHAPIAGLGLMADLMQEGRCSGMHALDLLALTQALQLNTSFMSRESDLLILSGRFRELSGQTVAALNDIRRAYVLSGNPEPGFIELRLLTMAGWHDEAEAKLDSLERHIVALGGQYARYLRDVATWRQRLSEEKARMR